MVPSNSDTRCDRSNVPVTYRSGEDLTQNLGTSTVPQGGACAILAPDGHIAHDKCVAA